MNDNVLLPDSLRAKHVRTEDEWREICGGPSSPDSKAHWRFIFQGDSVAWQADMDACPLDFVAQMWREVDERYARMFTGLMDDQLGGRHTFPYPRQLAFLDFITETPNFKAGAYWFMKSLDIPALDGTYGWRLHDYLEAKGLAKKQEGIQHSTLRVSDLDNSLAIYQPLLGAIIVSRSDTEVVLENESVRMTLVKKENS